MKIIDCHLHMPHKMTGLDAFLQKNLTKQALKLWELFPFRLRLSGKNRQMAVLSPQRNALLRSETQ